MRRKTKNPAEKLRQKCVTFAKKLRRTLQGFMCEYCGKREPDVATHGSHVYSEGVYRSMSADLDNIICLCFTHHLNSWNGKEPSWHKDPVTMVAWFNEKYPERAASLKERARKPQQADLFFWEKKWGELQEHANI